MLIVVCGLQGSGKSVVSKRIQENTGYSLLRTDLIRNGLYKNPAYSEEELQSVYEEMFRRIEVLLPKEDIILDGTFAKESNRYRAKNLAGNECMLVEVVCQNEKTIERRVNERKNDPSSADFKKYLEYKKRFELIKEEHIVIDNSGSLEETYRQIDSYFRKNI